MRLALLVALSINQVEGQDNVIRRCAVTTIAYRDKQAYLKRRCSTCSEIDVASPLGFMLAQGNATEKWLCKYLLSLRCIDKNRQFKKSL